MNGEGTAEAESAKRTNTGMAGVQKCAARNGPPCEAGLRMRL
jgi:hypothetical protein